MMSREKALTAREFERLLIGAARIDDRAHQIEARALVLVGGRLGLRPGEITHLSAEWVDDRRDMIQIPEHDPCTNGRDGEPCGYCKQAAEQMQRHGDARDHEAILEEYWSPKTDAGARDVPFGWSQRTAVAIELLVDEHGEITMQSGLTQTVIPFVRDNYAAMGQDD